MALSKHVNPDRLIRQSRDAAGKLSTQNLISYSYGARYGTNPIPKFNIASKGVSAESAYRIIHDELALDGSTVLNLASFVHTWMPNEADLLVRENISKNLIDSDEYPATQIIHTRCIGILADMWHAPSAKQAVGTATTGSSEAIQLGGLAMKKLWQERRKAAGKSIHEPGPNIVMGANAQVALEKFARYFEVECRLVPVSEGSRFHLDPKKAMEYVDENTIGIFVILGSTYTGHYEPVKVMSDLLDEYEKKTGNFVPIHVDAASGGFIAPFVTPKLLWDFKLPRVVSINTSGHKFGLSYVGVGFVIWRDQGHLPKDLIFELHYLGSVEYSFSLNFSRPAAPIIAQYFNFLHLGFEGYRSIGLDDLKNARLLSRALEKSGYYTVLSDVHRHRKANTPELVEIADADVEAYEPGLPVVAFRFSDKFKRKNPDVQQKWVQTLLRSKGWIVPNYELPPALNTVEILRVVIRENITEVLVDQLINDIIEITEQLAKSGSSAHGLNMLSTIQSGRPKHEHEGSNLKKGEGSSHRGSYSRLTVQRGSFVVSHPRTKSSELSFFPSMALSKHVNPDRLIQQSRDSHGKFKSVSNQISYSYGARYGTNPIPKFHIASKGVPAESAYRIIHDELALDGSPVLNLASFVHTWMPNEADLLMRENISKNLIDSDEYPATQIIHTRCIGILADMWHAPSAKQAVGTATTGSSEAIQLGGLAMKKLWQERRKAAGKSIHEPGPNIVMGANAQVALEKFARYFEVECRLVPVSEESRFHLDPKKAMEYVDENTIGIFVILGSTYTGHYEPVKVMSDLLDEYEKKTGNFVPIHVDAASGGFVAPFVTPKLLWDFKLPRVVSINTSGHKFGLSYVGVGFIIWRDQGHLPKDLIFELHYLGSVEYSFSLNFSRPAAPIIAQYFNFLHLGFEGYRSIGLDDLKNARLLSRALEKSGYYTVLSDIHRKANSPELVEIVDADVEAYEPGLPVVAFRFSDNFKENHPDVQQKWIQTLLRSKGWIVPNYELPPALEQVEILRVVVRENMTEVLIDQLINDIIEVTEQLTKFGSSAHGLNMISNIQSGRPKHEHESSNLKKGEGSDHGGPYSRVC